jgi:hypothetical protein
MLPPTRRFRRRQSKKRLFPQLGLPYTGRLRTPLCRDIAIFLPNMKPV